MMVFTGQPLDPATKCDITLACLSTANKQNQHSRLGAPEHDRGLNLFSKACVVATHRTEFLETLDYRSLRGTTYHTPCWTIAVALPSGLALVAVTPTTTVTSILDELEEVDALSSLPMEAVSLVFASRVLNNVCTVARSGLKDLSLAFLIDKPHQPGGAASLSLGKFPAHESTPVSLHDKQVQTAALDVSNVRCGKMLAVLSELSDCAASQHLRSHAGVDISWNTCAP